MVSVRRVKLIVVIALTLVVFIGLYQLEKRHQTSHATGSFSNSGVKIPWRKSFNISNSVLTPKETVNGVKTTKTTPNRHRSLVRTKETNVSPEEEEEELVENEIGDTLEWVQRMGKGKRIDNKRKSVTALRDSEWSNFLDEVSPSPTAKDERDSKRHNVDTEVYDIIDNHATNKMSPTVKDGRGSSQTNTVTDLRDSTNKIDEDATKKTLTNADFVTKGHSFSTLKSETTARPKENKMTDFLSEKVIKSPSSTVTRHVQQTTTSSSKVQQSMQQSKTTTDFLSEITKSPSSTVTEHVQPTTHHSISSSKVQQSTQQSKKTTHLNPTTKTTAKSSTSMYTPSTLPRVNACNLPKLDPMDSSIRHLLKDVGFDPDCKSRYPRSLYDVIGNRLVLRDNSSINGIRLNSFLLDTIHRTKDSDTDFYTNKEVSPINVSTYEVYKSREILESDFFRISYQVQGKQKETHYYARAVPRQDVINKSKELRQGSFSAKKSLPLNVLMLGMDSTSSANFLRKMPHTLNWLQTQMRSFFMKGYSIVGDATTPALTALLTGNHEYDLPEGRRGFVGSEPIDKWPWISKHFESQGYVTLYGEDDPTMSTFNLRLHGFETPPYHHFMRAFWLAIESEGLRDEPGICSRDMSLVNYTLDYLQSFFEAYKDTPKFAMGFLSYLTHAHPNHLSFGDYDLLSFLNEMKSRGYLNDTLLVILGDHGSRNDDVRSTMQGKLEERLPWLSISVPDWLESHYPELVAALVHNEDIISSPFDLHTTLRHILTYPEMPDAKTYRSLLTNMSRDRTCIEAGIDEHWCPCLQFKPIDVKSKDVKRAAVAVVEHINKRLNSSDVLRMSCHVVKLTAVHNAMQYEPNDKVQRFSSTNQDSDREVSYGTRTRDDRHFLVTIETSPMGALFEATVTIRDKSVVVNPNISRINIYGNQPSCIAKKYPYLKKYCVCKA